MALRGPLDTTPTKGYLGADGGMANGTGMGSYAGRGTPVDPNYHYGYPAYTGGGTQPNVTAQWIFDEGSGNIVDEVASVTLTQNGTPLYGITASGLFINLSPGITVSTNNGDDFRKDTATPSLDMGTSNCTKELWFKTTQTTFGVFISTSDLGGTERGWYLGINSNTSILAHYRAETDEGGDIAMTCPSISDGLLHKLRIIETRASTVEFKLDGVSLGTGDISATSGKTITAHRCYVGNYSAGPAAGNKLAHTAFEFRFSQNNSNNSSGPNGG